MWLIGHLLLSSIVGLGISLFFLGTLSQTVPAISKIFLLCLVSGFGAPKLLGHIDNEMIRKLENIIRGMGK